MLVSIKDLTKEEIISIVNRAKEFKGGKCTGLNPAYSSDKKTVCLMFFENSTRTKCSFDLAAQKLGMNVLNFDAATSSINKGEGVKDTIENLLFIGVDTFVIRHKEDDFIKRVLDEVSYPINIINAGLGTTSHPTQALLDFMTMRAEAKKVSIVGDIEHSRVAHSNKELLEKFGIAVNLIDTINGGRIEEIAGSDVVMLLRVQKERFEYKMETYPTLTTELLNKYAPNAILMHPGPVNREVEISSELLDSERGKTILEQARNGVFIRMAVLERDFR